MNLRGGHNSLSVPQPHPTTPPLKNGAGEDHPEEHQISIPAPGRDESLHHQEGQRRGLGSQHPTSCHLTALLVLPFVSIDTNSQEPSICVTRHLLPQLKNSWGSRIWMTFHFFPMYSDMTQHSKISKGYGFGGVEEGGMLAHPV